MDVTLIETREGLEDAARQLVQQPRIACDIEADGLFRYRAKVCVLQLSTEQHAYVIDTLAVWDAELMQPVLGSQGPLKIIHDLSFDARLLREALITLGNVQDTSIAARFLGEKSLGLGSLLSSRLGVTVDKNRQKQDWSRRPLQQDDVDYLVGDVEHLFRLADMLHNDVTERGISDEVGLETQYMLARALAEPTTDPVPAWTKVKGAREQAPLVRSTLRELLRVREELAQKHDVPPFKVVGEDSLVAASLKRPSQPDAFVKLGFRGQFARDASADWMQGLRIAAERGDVPAVELETEPREVVPTREQRNRWKQRESALKAWRTAQAKARTLEPSVLLPGHCLTDVVQLEADTLEALAAIPGFGAVRVTRDGEAILKALRAASPVA